MVKQFTIVPNELNVCKTVLHYIVLAGLQQLSTSAQIHRLFDDVWVLKQAEADVVHWLSELNAILVLQKLLEYLVALPMVLLVE